MADNTPTYPKNCDDCDCDNAVGTLHPIGDYWVHCPDCGLSYWW